jgi:DNA gyrase subunit B
MISGEQDIERIRQRPGLYVGDTNDGEGLHNLVQELTYNALGEAAAGYGKKIDIRLNANGSCTVRDEGRGIPVDMHREFGVSAAQVVMTILHFRPIKSSYSNDNVRRLIHVGAVVVNALSEWLELRIWRQGQEWFMRFNNGKPEAPIKSVGSSKNRSGTEVTFLPSSAIFARRDFDFAVLEDRLRKISVVNSDICLMLIDERSPERKSVTCLI